MYREHKVTATQVYPMGVCFQQDGLHIAAVCPQAACKEESFEFGVILYDRRHRDGIRIPFPKEGRVGCVCAMLLQGYHDKECRYLFYCDDRIWQDPYCRKIEHIGKYGLPKKDLPRCMVYEGDYDWQEDRTLNLPYENMILYALHVRGFTKHRSSGVKYKGTYLGITEKIPYFRELGITSLLLMPAYEFDEIMVRETFIVPQTMEQAAASYMQPLQADAEEDGKVEETVYKINYWGYRKGLYYLPKSGYAHGRDSVTEYKNMVKELHRSGLEVLMQFYFPPEVSPMEMLAVLKYWVLEYHIDGFHVMGSDLPISQFSKDPVLSETKILTEQQYRPGASDPMAQTRRIGWMSESFMYDMRRAVKGDEDIVNRLIFHVRNNMSEAGIVNYIAKWEGLRLMDMVSYDRKHNELNGENNQDGTDYNCSWNCGAEGKSRRKQIMQLRMRQIKNALSLVFLSQGTPLLYSGDEFGNTQEGNNNPYCQDNAITWIKWNLMESGRELLEYTKMLINLRRTHPVLHSKIPLRGMDYLSCGYPDISYHGRDAWRPDTGPASRSIGIMYCGCYGDIQGKKDDTLFYIGINLHWRAHYFGLPQLPKGKKWELYASTEFEETRADREHRTSEEAGESGDAASEMIQEICIGPRAIAIYMAADLPATADCHGKKNALPGREKNPRATGRETP